MSTDDWIKIIPPVVGGGVMGAIVTALITNSRNKIQPVSRRITVSSVNIPAIMTGYDSKITLLHSATGSQYQFDKIFTIQLELSNIGNKDLSNFDVGVTLPPTASIIGVQHDGPDRLHHITHTPDINIDNVSNQVDFQFKYFNRQDAYTITLVACYSEDDLLSKIHLSKNQPVKFVDATLIDKELAEIIKSTVKEYPFGSLYILPVMIGTKLLIRRMKR